LRFNPADHFFTPIPEDTFVDFYPAKSGFPAGLNEGIPFLATGDEFHDFIDGHQISAREWHAPILAGEACPYLYATQVKDCYERD